MMMVDDVIRTMQSGILDAIGSRGGGDNCDGWEEGLDQLRGNTANTSSTCKDQNILGRLHTNKQRESVDCHALHHIAWHAKRTS
jgi:hypothetical protein